MALSKKITKSIKGFVGELVCNNAYCRVNRVDGGKEKAQISVEIFNEKNGTVIETLFYDFTPSMEGLNFIAQAYQHLKTLPEFADAKDC